MDLDYDRYHRRYHDHSDRHFGETVGCAAAKLAPPLPADRSARILEIGCGMGFALGALRQLGYADVEGIDADGGQIATGRRRDLPALHVPVEARDSPTSTSPRPSRRGARAFPSYPAARWRGGCCARASWRCGASSTASSSARRRPRRSR